MTIQWFPGHMTRARREIEQKLKLIDLVIELLDARIPYSSRNPMIDEIIHHKPRLILLNKADLADPDVTEQWVQYYAGQGIQALPFNSTADHRQSLISEAKRLLAEQITRQLNKGMNPRAMRGLIVGIPNVGKSTLINRLAGRRVALTGDRPGVTKGQQWIKVGQELELLDTPGILWPKFEDQEVGIKLAITGAIKEQLLVIEDIAFHTIRYLMRHYPERLEERYNLAWPKMEEDTAIVDEADDNQMIVEIMEEIGRKRGCVQSGGRIDLARTAGIIVRELRAGTLGRVSLERPSHE